VSDVFTFLDSNLVVMRSFPWSFDAQTIFLVLLHLIFFILTCLIVPYIVTKSSWCFYLVSWFGLDWGFFCIGSIYMRTFTHYNWEGVGSRDGTRRVWVRVEPPHTRTHLPWSYPLPVPIPANGYKNFPYPSPARVNGYSRVKIPAFTTHQFEQKNSHKQHITII
jgi:hypothetical protein